MAYLGVFYFCLDPTNGYIEFLPSHISVIWFPGVAFSKHIVQTYTFVPNGDLRQQAEVCAYSNTDWGINNNRL
jgi:hypothetical protein